MGAVLNSTFNSFMLMSQGPWLTVLSDDMARGVAGFAVEVLSTDAALTIRVLVVLLLLPACLPACLVPHGAWSG
jgi:hypothetical protein